MLLMVLASTTLVYLVRSITLVMLWMVLASTTTCRPNKIENLGPMCFLHDAARAASHGLDVYKQLPRNSKQS